MPPEGCVRRIVEETASTRSARRAQCRTLGTSGRRSPGSATPRTDSGEAADARLARRRIGRVAPHAVALACRRPDPEPGERLRRAGKLFRAAGRRGRQACRRRRGDRRRSASTCTALLEPIAPGRPARVAGDELREAGARATSRFDLPEPEECSNQWSSANRSSVVVRQYVRRAPGPRRCRTTDLSLGKSMPS